MSAVAASLPTQTGQQLSEAAVSLKAVSKVYPKGTQALNEMTLDFPRGQLTSLRGASGCGKTTLMVTVLRNVAFGLELRGTPPSEREAIAEKYFSAVDEQRRRKFKEDLLQLVEEEKKTFIVVTHSMEESVYVSDQIALLLATAGKT